MNYKKIKKLIITLLIISILLPIGSGIASNMASEDHTDPELTELIASGAIESTVDLEAMPETVKSVPDAQSENAYAYVSHATIEKIADGTAPWDLSDTPGNDSSESNGVVRTYDTVVYTPKVSVSSLTNENYTSGELCFQVTLPMDITRAVFNLEHMTWLTDYTIEYFSADGTKLASGSRSMPKYSANLATDSGQGTGSYQTDVAYQRLTGKYTMKGATSATVVIPGTQTLSIGINVTNAVDGDLVQAVMRFWMDGNPDNLDRNGQPVDSELIPSAVRVSAKARYNLKIAQVSSRYCNLFGYFSLEDGTFSKTPVDGSVRGRLQGYGVSLQLYNETDNPKVTRASKGFKGIELPQGEISYDIKWTIRDNNGVLPKTGVAPILWDYSNNSGNSDKGNLGRNLVVDGNWSYAVVANPLGKTYTGKRTADTDDRLYREGSVSLEGEIYRSLDEVPGLESPTYRVTASDYDFDLDKMRFPRRYSDSGDNSSSAENIYIGTFATQYFGVVLQCQEEYANAETICLEAEVSNISATSLGGQETSYEVLKSENKTSRDVTMYVPASFEKRLTFTALSAKDYQNYSGFSSQSYASDGSVVAGGQVAAWATSRPSRDGDNEYISSDTLLKFDARAFSINTDYPLYQRPYNSFTEYERCDFFYAADPLYPDGYDSNNAKDFERMNKATTSDYTYFKTLEELEEAGFTCTAILMEMRGAKYIDRNNWRDHAFRVIFNATEEAAMIGKTAAIISFSEGWTNIQDLDSSLTWGDSASNNLKRVDRTLTAYRNSIPGRISGTKLENDPSKGYVKAEFDENGVITGTHKGGEKYGNTVTIVGYQSAVTARSDKSGYDLGYGERVAGWTVSPSSAYKSGSTTLNMVDAGKKTNLTITLSAENGHTLMAGTYAMGGVSLGDGTGVTVPYSFKDASGTTHTSEFKASYMYDDTGKLMITCSDVVAGVALPNITVSTAIGNPGSADDVVNNQELRLTARIRGSGDGRAYMSHHGNIATASTRAIKLNATALYKTADKALAEVGEGFTHTVTYLNVDKENDTGAFRMIDRLPYNGDGRGTSFSGSYKVGELTVSVPGKNAQVYVCEGKPGTGADGMTWTNFDTAFTKIGETSNGKLNVTLNRYISGIAVRADGIAPNGKMEVSCRILPEGNGGGDIYANHAETLLDGTDAGAALASNIVQTAVVQRSVSGTAWVDENGDGQMNDGEERLAGIRVELYQKDGSKWVEATNIYGEKVEAAATDSDGTYNFSDLAEGTYKMKFSDFKDNVFETVTEKEVSGGVTSMTSKADMQGDEVVIDSTNEYPALILPAANEMNTATYTIPYMNVGAVYSDATVDLSFTVVDPEGNPLKGAELTLYKCEEDHEHGQHTEDCSREEIGSVKTGKDGIVKFEDIPSGEYFLVETKAPNGFQIPQGILSVTVTEENHEASASYDAGEGVLFDADTLSIINTLSAELPNAGLFSRAEFLAGFGIVAMIASAVGLIIKKKRMY